MERSIALSLHLLMFLGFGHQLSLSRSRRRRRRRRRKRRRRRGRRRRRKRRRRQNILGISTIVCICQNVQTDEWKDRLSRTNMHTLKRRGGDGCTDIPTSRAQIGLRTWSSQADPMRTRAFVSPRFASGGKLSIWGRFYQNLTMKLIQNKLERLALASQYIGWIWMLKQDKLTRL